MATKEEPYSVLRDPLALAMIAAWLNVKPEQLPPTLNAHTCEATMEAWLRVGLAAKEYFDAKQSNSPSS